MRVRIVCYEDVNAWILGKFARKLNEELTKLGINSDIAKESDPKADINHHIIYSDYNGKPSSNDTLMITHIDTLQKLNLIKKQLTVARVGICMSNETMQKLVSVGIPKEKLFYIDPAQDGKIKPRHLVIGVMGKTHDDGRKNYNFIYELGKKISPQDYMFKIMGGGWDEIVQKINKLGFEIEYHNKFDYDSYVKLMPTLDYYLYFGFDEGSMGFLDALAAGVKTVVTPQGYHLDAPNGIVYSIKNLDDAVKVFKQISAERNSLTQSVSSWTWENYAKEHIEVWARIINKKSLFPLLSKKLRDSNNINKLGFYFLLVPMTLKTLLRRILP